MRPPPEQHAPHPAEHRFDADVLVLGGGPAGTWAALTAAEAGARVVLADKGYCGTSGATAPSNTGAWYLPPGPAREAEAERRLARGHGLADRRWILRVIDQAWQNLDVLAERGYPFPVDEGGRPYRANLRGPDYMRFMRRRVDKARVRVLDHSPALELLWHDGTVAGAAGVRPRDGSRWEVRAGAVVMATGGCTFLSRALGTDGNTGDGYLMGAEAGARLSGVEFSSQYGVSLVDASITKGLSFMFANFALEDGSPLPEGADRASRIARALIEGRRVFGIMDKGTPQGHAWLRQGQPNTMLPFDRAGIDPYSERFEVTLRSEGLVRGVGGLELVSDDCATDVPGLYAAGDAATRENLAGAVTGGGSPNASWAMASGSWSGRAATRFGIAQRSAAPRPVRALGGAGLRPTARPYLDAGEVTRFVQGETLPLDVNFFRSGARIAESRQALTAAWADIRAGLSGEGRGLVRAREAAAMAATARFIWEAAALRTESRGMHRRLDLPDEDATFDDRIHVSGVDQIAAAFRNASQEAVAS
ncbi:FAD-dependent oxidoreductase [Sphingomonas sp. 3-13AW]|jgi:succinate dehydrogenase/fumarate reductase flavoprotein subunit|uniref:FAD-dependent oxidoreductase n=1 Tax=Sphingomonas sp. 3-13AW TaxID=3050450 RepID=UPI003BB7EFC6